MKKPTLKSATPNDDESSALYSDAAHDELTDRFTSPDRSNRVLIVAIARVTEAGGHDDNGDRITKIRLDHIEAAFSEADEKKAIDLLSKMHRGRTQSNTVAALVDPVPDEKLPGMDETDPDGALNDSTD